MIMPLCKVNLFPSPFLNNPFFIIIMGLMSLIKFVILIIISYASSSLTQLTSILNLQPPSLPTLNI